MQINVTIQQILVQINVDMKRNILSKLIEWKNKKNRKPLIVNGARQVGKTYICFAHLSGTIDNQRLAILLVFPFNEL